MSVLIESVPNISEGRDLSIIKKIAEAVLPVPGVTLADFSSDLDHNRSVFTLIGTPEAVVEAVLSLAAKTVKLIDLSKHNGVHPRLGAIDVIPFVPFKNEDMPICVETAKQVGERIGNILNIPVFLYEEAAVCEERRNLSDIRKNYHAGWKPDFGPQAPHPTAGVVTVGARKILIAFNINLNTDDIAIAKKIARRIRTSNGGLKHCKALGIRLKSRGIVQVTMNMTSYMETALHEAYELVKTEAEKMNVQVLESELVGMAPAQALADAGARYLGLKNYCYNSRVLDHFLL